MIHLLPHRRPSSDWMSAITVAGASVVSAFMLLRLGSFDNQVKGLALGLVLGAVPIALLRPRLAIGAVVAFAPFQFLFKIGGVSAGTNEVLVFGVALVVAPQIARRDIPRPYAIGAFSLVGGSVIAAADAIDGSAALWGAARWAAVLVIGAAAFGVFRGQLDMVTARYADIVAVTGVAVAGGAFLQRSNIDAVVGAPYLADRVDSFFGYYTQYSGYLAAVLVIATAQVGHAFFVQRTRRRATLHLVAAVAAGLGLGTSLSRGGFLAAAVGLAALSLLTARSGRRIVGMAIVIPLIAGAAWTLTPADTRAAYVARIVQPVGASGGDRQRAALQRAGLAAARELPLGIGYGNFPAYQSLHVSDPNLSQTFFHAHRLPVQVALDAGWIGLCGFLLLTLGGAMLVVRAALAAPVDLRTAGITAALVGLFAQGWYDYLFFELSFLVVFTTLAWFLWFTLDNSR